MRGIVIKRIPKNDLQTLGILTVLGKEGFPLWECRTLELPDKDNQKRISCIPEGLYTVVKRHSPKYKDHFHILDVPNRDYILIHPANYVRQLLGCIAVGEAHTDIDGDGLRDVTASKRTLKKLLSYMPDEFKLIITS